GVVANGFGFGAIEGVSNEVKAGSTDTMEGGGRAGGGQGNPSEVAKQGLILPQGRVLKIA
ncbi:MAG: hypothetical protein EA366_02950, partial [Spirulina sp. DLM2.Bin59]